MQMLLVHFDNGGDLWPTSRATSQAGSLLFALACDVSESWNQAKDKKGAELIKGLRSLQTSSTCENAGNLRVEIRDTKGQHD